MTSPATTAAREKAEQIMRLAGNIHSDGMFGAIPNVLRHIITAALAAEREAAIAECREWLAQNGHKQALADMERKENGR